MSLDIPSILHSCIVPLETVDESKFIGTGFLLQCYGYAKDPSYAVPAIITNRHIVKDEKIQFRSNISGGGLRRFQIGDVVEDLSFDWVFHSDENIDLAAALCPLAIEGASEIILVSDVNDVSNFNEGRELFYLGFPLAKGAEAETQHHPILRVGTLSRKGDPAFIMEANVFPGSSGSPVFTKPRIQLNENGECILDPIMLLGVVSSYIPYQDIAVSSQTGNPRIVFEDNSGLSWVYKIQHVLEILNSSEFTEQAKPIVEYIGDNLGQKLSPMI